MNTNEFMTQTWKQVILPFEIDCEYENPFLDVSIEGVFTGPSGQKIVREAYWDGGKSYKIAFAPTEVGQWKWMVKAPEESGLNEKTGQVTCVKYEGDLPIYKHGFLRVDASRRFLTYQDGTAFFWLGDTHWEFAYGENWEESNHPQMDSMFRGMVDRRVTQGFTVYQTNLRSDPGSWGGADNYWAEGKVGSLPNVLFYQEELDRRMEYLADSGLVNALGFAWFMSIQNNITTYKNMARYMVARYGALPMVWTLAGEVAGYFGEPSRTEFINGWREVAKYIEKIDGYGQLQTAHYTNERPFADYYYDEDWFDFTLNQAGHGDFNVTAQDFYEYRKAHPDKPFVEGESLYEFCSTLEENGSRLCTADMVRKVAYTAMQLGSCGYTYGAQGIWDNVWEKPEKPDPFNVFNRFGITWYEAVDGVGAIQMGYMRQFYENEHFEKLVPIAVSATSPFGNGEEGKVDMFSPLATANSDRSHIIIYYNEHARGGCGISELKQEEYTSLWFDPRTGEYSSAVTSFIPSEGKWEAPAREQGGDWILVLKLNSAN
jgi:hypothetical protein